MQSRQSCFSAFFWRVAVEVLLQIMIHQKNNDPLANNDPPGGDTGGDTGGDNASATSASACFNANLFVSSAKYETVARTTDADGGVVETTSQVNTDGAAIFPPTGQTLTKVIANVSSSLFGLATSEFFLDVDPAVPEIRTYGVIAGDETMVDGPYQLQRFNLELGDSYEQTYSQDEILPDKEKKLRKRRPMLVVKRSLYQPEPSKIVGSK